MRRIKVGVAVRGGVARRRGGEGVGMRGGIGVGVVVGVGDNRA